jgi:hypothetical protein
VRGPVKPGEDEGRELGVPTLRIEICFP